MTSILGLGVRTKSHCPLSFSFFTSGASPQSLPSDAQFWHQSCPRLGDDACARVPCLPNHPRPPLGSLGSRPTHLPLFRCSATCPRARPGRACFVVHGWSARHKIQRLCVVGGRPLGTRAPQAQESRQGERAPRPPTPRTAPTASRARSCPPALHTQPAATNGPAPSVRVAPAATSGDGTARSNAGAGGWSPGGPTDAHTPTPARPPWHAATPASGVDRRVRVPRPGGGGARRHHLHRRVQPHRADARPTRQDREGRAGREGPGVPQR